MYSHEYIICSFKFLCQVKETICVKINWVNIYEN